MITKRNIVTYKTGMMFLSSRIDVPRPRRGTYDQSNHTYVHMRQYKREITRLESMEISKNFRRKEISINIGGYK